MFSVSKAFTMEGGGGGGGGGGGQQASYLVAKKAVEFLQILVSLHNNTLSR